MMINTEKAVPDRRFSSCLELLFLCLPFRPNCVFTIYEHFYSEQFYGTIDAGVDYLMYNEKIPIYGIERMKWMNKEPIMMIHVEIDRSNCPEMTMTDGKVKIIPFTGTVEGKLFHGRIMPGAADVQVTNPAGVRHMCAQYMLEGLDNTGAACHIFVENHGYFERDHRPKPFEAWPTFRTDSQALRSYLQGMHFRAEGYSNEIGVDIRIFDTDE